MEIDIRKAYYMATGHIDGNYNKMSAKLIDKTQSICDFFNFMMMQRIHDATNMEERGDYDLLDVFLLTFGTVSKMNEVFAFIENASKPGYEQIDDFLYPICPEHEMYRAFNSKFGIAEKQYTDSVYKEILTHPEIRTILQSYVKYLKASEVNNVTTVSILDKILRLVTYGDENKNVQAVLPKEDNSYDASRKIYEKMWFSIDEQRILEYDKLCDDYEKKLNASTKKQEVVVSTAQRKMDKLVDLYNFKSKTKGIFDQIVGQREQLDQILHSLYNAQLGLNNPNGPRASMLLTGPTGVGKTETAYAISKALYEKDPFVIDLSVYHGSHQLSTLIGAPPGYIGYSDKPALLEYLKNNTNGGVLLFDEFDKANPQVLNIFMHMLDKGEIQSAKGECYDVRNFVVITTSNITEKVNKHVGFGAEQESVRNTISSNAVGCVPPELVARFDLVTAYQKLSKEEKIELARRKMDSICNRIKHSNDYLNIKISYDDAVLEQMASGVNDSMGIRELFRDVSNLATKKLVDYIMNNDDFTNLSIKIKSIDDVVVTARNKKEKTVKPQQIEKTPKIEAEQEISK